MKANLRKEVRAQFTLARIFWMAGTKERLEFIWMPRMVWELTIGMGVLFRVIGLLLRAARNNLGFLPNGTSLVFLALILIRQVHSHLAILSISAWALAPSW